MYDFDTIVKFLTLAIGIIGLFKVLLEYTKAQRWKRAEFLAKEMKEFFADSNVKRALLLFDWNIVNIPLNENEIENKTMLLFEDEMLVKALEYHDEMSFNDEETVIRQIIDDFLFKLGMFQNYVDSKLVSKKDLEPYLLYWILLIGGVGQNKKAEKILKKLWGFIIYYNYNQVIKLVNSFGYSIAI